MASREQMAGILSNAAAFLNGLPAQADDPVTMSMGRDFEVHIVWERTRRSTIDAHIGGEGTYWWRVERQRLVESASGVANIGDPLPDALAKALMPERAS